MAFFNYRLTVKRKDGFEIEIVKGVSREGIINFTYEMGVLLESGIPVLKALALEKRSAGERGLEIIAERMISSLERGASLTEALMEFPGEFEGIYVRLINIGELSGNLSGVMKIVGEHLRQRERIRKKMRSAWVYPKLVIATTLASTLFLINYVLPKFVEIVQENSDVHPLTGFLLDLNSFFRERYLLVGISLLLLFIIIKILKNFRWFRKTRTLIEMKIPVAGEIFRNNVEINFLRNMELILSAGIPITHGITMLAEMEENHLFRRELENLLDGIRNGMRVKESLEGSGFISGTSLAMIGVGEESGNLPELFGKGAAYSVENLEVKIEKMLHLMEPMLILFLGGIVGTVILGIYLPIFDMAGGVG